MDPLEATTSSSSNPAKTRTLRSGKDYNQDPSIQYKKRSYKSSTKSTIARARKVIKGGSSSSSTDQPIQPTILSPTIQPDQLSSKDSDDNTIAQTVLNTIPETSENFDSNEETITYTEAIEGFSPISEQRRQNTINLTITQEESEYPPLDLNIENLYSDNSPINHSQELLDQVPNLTT